MVYITGTGVSYCLIDARVSGFAAVAGEGLVEAEHLQR